MSYKPWVSKAVDGSSLYVVVYVGLVAFAAFALAKRRNANSLVWVLVSIVFPPSLILLFFSKVRSPEGGDEAWKNQFQNFRFSHYYKGTGIAIDESLQKLYLAGFDQRRPIQKCYSFDDVRRWRYNISSGGHHVVYGNAGLNASMGVLGQNIRQNRQNENETGFFVEVKDIEFPEWRITFAPGKMRETEMKKWMEIMRQQLNRD